MWVNESLSRLLNLLQRILIWRMSVILDHRLREKIVIHPGERFVIRPRKRRCRLYIGRSRIVNADVEIVCDMIAVVNSSIEHRVGLAFFDVTKSIDLFGLLLNHLVVIYPVITG